jgi:pimeloyl-ACP methyl ester carboxylesterase
MDSPSAAFTVSTSLGEVSVRITEGPGKTALLLLHANPGDSRDFDAVLPALAQVATVVAMDWPGYGQSTVTEPERVTAQALVDVAEQVLGALGERGMLRLVLIGNSVGGYVAVRLAQSHPATVAGLVLVDTAGFTRHNPLTRTFSRHVMGRPGIARHLVAPLARAYLGRLRTPGARATWARAREVSHNPRRLAVHCAIWRSFTDADLDLTILGRQPKAPTLLVWGTRDPVVPAALDGRRACNALAPVRYVPMPTGHEPFNERPQLFLDHVLPFLREEGGVGPRQYGP